MLEGLAPDLAPRLMIAIGGVALAFIVLILVLVFLKRKNAPLFVKGGRAREHRLVVLDAAAVDAKRRLVLIRRDETEHLIMIGGPTDIVIETGINSASRQPEILPAVGIQPAADRLVAETRAALAAPAREQPAEPARIEAQPAETDRSQAERRAERQARRQERAQAETRAAATGISAAGAVLHGSQGREPAFEAPEAQPADPDARVVPLTAQAGDRLDQVRNRVLTDRQQQPAAEKAVTDEAAVKAMTERLEAAHAEAVRIEAEKSEAARAEAERAEAARAEAERAEAARIEAERAEAARIQAEQEEAARLAAQREEAERLYAQQMAARRLEAERLERERAEARRLESARLRAEAERRARAEEAERQALAEEAARRAEAERQQLERERVEAESQRVEPVASAAYAEHMDNAPESLATDFEKLLEVELQKGGILDESPAPEVQAEPRDHPNRPGIYPIRRDPGSVVTGATPGQSAEQDMARRLGEVSLNKKT